MIITKNNKDYQITAIYFPDEGGISIDYKRIETVDGDSMTTGTKTKSFPSFNTGTIQTYLENNL